uniref:NAD(P)H dehydrogenase (quinone) n=1 Tax=Nicotiana tabacum TaxID=4097 RepID=A0A1S3YSA1_TOBAC
YSSANSLIDFASCGDILGTNELSFPAPWIGPLKNAIDWASRPPNVWADKAAAIVSAGGGFGGGRSQYHLRQIGVYLDLHFINKPEFFLNAFQPPSKFDSDGVLTDEETKQKLRAVLLSLQAFTLRLKGKCE